MAFEMLEEYRVTLQIHSEVWVDFNDYIFVHDMPAEKLYQSSEAESVK